MKLLLSDQRVDTNKANTDRETPFFTACLQGHIEIVKLLLNDKRVEVNKARPNEVTPFYITCEYGHIEIVKLLLNNERVDVNKSTNDGATSLYSACEKGYIEIVKLLLNDERVDINKAMNTGATPFYIACKNGHIDIVKLFLNDNRVDINKANNDGWTPLYIACLQGHIEIVKLLLNDKRIDVNQRKKNYYYSETPFYIACEYRHVEIVKLLLNDERVDINKAMNTGATPFYIACKNGHIEIVKLLLNDERVDINKTSEQNWTPFFIACKNGHIEIVRLLLSDERADLNNATPFYIACEYRHVEIVKLLLNDERVDINKTNWREQTPLWIACENGYIEIVKLLLNDERIDINKTSEQNWTPFFIARKNGHIEVVKLLLNDQRFEINKAEKSIGATPFYFACLQGYTDIVKLLLNDERVDVNQSTYDGETPFSIACHFGNLEVVKLLLNDERVDINKSNNDGVTPFFIACGNGHIEIVKLLLNDQRVDINKATNDGVTPFFIACENRKLKIAKLLLNDQRVDINQPKTGDGQMPFLVEWKKKHIEIVKLLLTDKGNHDRTPFWIACQKGHIGIVKLLLNDVGVEVNKPNKYGWTPLYIACGNGHIEIVKLLLNDQRVDVNQSDKYGQTPFYNTCEKGHVEIVKLLLNDQRIDINKGKYDDETPFFIACWKGHIEIVELLLNDQRIDVNQANNDGKTPFWITCGNGHTEIVKLLLNDNRVDINKARTDGATPFSFACRNGQIEIVQYMFASGRDVDMMNKENGKSTIDIARKSQKNCQEESQKGKYAKIIELMESFQQNPNGTRSKLREHLLVEEYSAFRESIEIEKNEKNITILKTATTFIGIEPSYFLPLTAKSQNQITHLFINNTPLESIPISFDSFQSLIHLDLSNNKINDKNILVVSKLIQKSKEIVVIDLRNNQITEKGANVIEKSLELNSSLTDLLLDGNNISELKCNEINEILKRKRNTLDFNTVSVYLLGYGHVGKTTLRQTIKNMNSFLTSWIGFSQRAQTINNNLQTECVEIDRRVNIGKTNIQIIDFGGQKEYHHGTHLFTKITRSIFLILANPFDLGFEEQIWYWLRLLNIKSSRNQSQNQKAEAMIIFSHRDKENDSNEIQMIETTLEKLVNELKIEFEETININSLWIWMDCTNTNTNEMGKLLNELGKTVKKVMEEFRVNIPDISIPQMIINNLNQIFYERNELEIEIGKILKSNEIIASHWINILHESHDFLSIQINCGVQKGKEYICVDLEKFGKDILSKIIKPEASKYIYTSNDLVDKILSKENGKWKPIFCEILESLELCFEKKINEYLFPSMLPIHLVGDTQKKWKEDKEDEESKLNGMKYLGRRIKIKDKRLMFHPSFLPQLICHLLSGFVVEKEPLIWNEGLIFKHSKEYFIGLFMHGMMESSWKHQTILNNRKHGKPNRLKMMDILIKGPNIEGCQILMNTCLESIKYINTHFYGNLKWNQKALFPSTIRKYYSIIDKRKLFSIPLNQSDGNDQIQSIIREGISEEKLLVLYNSKSKNENINEYIIHIAFHEGYFEMAKKIIEQETQNQDQNKINKINDEIMFGIYLSCQNGHSNILEYVIGSGIQIDFRKTFRYKNCLEIASEEQNTEIVNIICEFQRDPLKIKTEYRKKYGFPSEEEIEILVIFEKKKEEMKVTLPFSLYELSLSIKSVLQILDDIQIQIWDRDYEEYLDLKRVEKVKMKSKLKIIASSFWTMQVDDRWDRQGKGIKLEKLCIFENDKIIDKPLYNKFYEILTKLGFNQETQKFKEIFAINNMELKKGFEAYRNILFSRQSKSPEEFKSQSWKTKSDFELRSFFLDNLNDCINKFDWNDGFKPSVIPMIHGTCEKYIWQICQHGLTTLAKLDSGYYGQGVYFTRDLSYARSYAKIAASSNKSNEYFVICCVIPGNVYPVTEHPESSNSLKGKPLIPGYQSHFTIVDKRNIAKAYPITTKKFIPKKEYHADELVVFQDAQVLPIFVFSLL